MSGHTASHDAHGHGAPAAHGGGHGAAHGGGHGGHVGGHGGGHGGHDEHGHSGVDPMKVKIGLFFGLMIFTVVLVTVFAYSESTASASVFTTKAKDPVILAATQPRDIGNPCDTDILQYFILFWNRCR